MNNNFESKTHCVFSLTYHVILVTKFRKHILAPQVLSYLYTILPQLAESVKTNITEIKGEADHIHFILKTTPQDKLGSVIGVLKCKSASLLLQRFKAPNWGRHARTIWSKSYFVCSTGGAPIEILKKYIQSQGR